MNPQMERELEEQRTALRLQLQAQRAVIAQQLEPPYGVRGHFPRSMTLRMLTRWPGLTATLIARVAKVLTSR